MIDIEYALWRLEGVFHKEDHFKQEFALMLNKLLEDQGKGGTVRLEWKTEAAGDIDLAIRTENRVIPIELKYKTKAATVEDKRFNEKFSISRHGAYDQGMYSFIEDISNLETVAEEFDTEAYAIFLSNEPNYWKEGEGAVYDNLRLSDGRTISGMLDWTDERSWQESNNMDQPLNLDYRYKLEWLDYAYRPDIEVEGADRFRVLPVRIPPEST